MDPERHDGSLAIAIREVVADTLFEIAERAKSKGDHDRAEELLFQAREQRVSVVELRAVMSALNSNVPQRRSGL